MDPRCKVALVLAKMDYSHENSKEKSVGNPKNRHGAHTGKMIALEETTLFFLLEVLVF